MSKTLTRKTVRSIRRDAKAQRDADDSSPFSKASAMAQAKRNARYRHGQWFVWCHKETGDWYCGPYSNPAIIEDAERNIDTNESVYLIGGGGPHSMVFTRFSGRILKVWARNARPDPKIDPTPGPWQIDSASGPNGDTYSVSHLWTDAGGETHTDEIATMVMDYADGIPEANARLIAAAPDLLEACKAMIDCTNAEGGIWIPPKGTSIRAIKLAIAKAEGTVTQ